MDQRGKHPVACTIAEAMIVATIVIIISWMFLNFLKSF